jgi:hypothetical protein
LTIGRSGSVAGSSDGGVELPDSYYHELQAVHAEKRNVFLKYPD